MPHSKVLPATAWRCLVPHSKALPPDTEPHLSDYTLASGVVASLVDKSGTHDGGQVGKAGISGRQIGHVGNTRQAGIARHA